MKPLIDVEAYYDKYSPMVYRRCKQLLGNEDDAMDALQDVFIKLINSEEKLHGQFPSSLLYTIATNTCLNIIRGRKRRQESAQTPEELVLPAFDQGYDEIEAKMTMDLILEDESESTRSICYMYHVDGMTLKEIGQVVGLSISGVRKRLNAFSARARLQIDGKDGGDRDG